ncbi:MAG TPA: hypothetical protein VMT53_14865 [Terriglobales bacterium]|nr:hypothetical protein [Terriglobales bacterium]
MRKKNPQLVPNNGNSQISSLSPEEEARALGLADVALHNPTAENTPRLAGTRAKDDHRKLMDELQREAEKTRFRKTAV